MIPRYLYAVTSLRTVPVPSHQIQYCRQNIATCLIKFRLSLLARNRDGNALIDDNFLITTDVCTLMHCCTCMFLFF